MMLSKLKKSEQILLVIVIAVLILGAYSFLRFIPKNDAIVTLQKQAAKVEKKLQLARVPDEPQQGVDELLKQLDDQEQALALIRNMADGVSQRFAPFDSQELKVRISELARNTRVRILTNETFKTVIKVNINKSKRKLKAKTIINDTHVILPANRSWIDRMSQKTMFYRPMQRLVFEGDYQSLRAFIHGLDALPWQVTVVRLNIERMPAAPIRGYAQLLKSELVLAL
ncbi:MAG: hypothetical protein COA95_11425 [Methylophaga sp.]|nr:MAG: hypothetical protein COA95_11425 [Methylophaga sp.]